MKGGDLLERTDPLPTRPDRRGRDRCPLQPLAEGPRSITKLPAVFYPIAAGILHKKNDPFDRNHHFLAAFF